MPASRVGGLWRPPATSSLQVSIKLERPDEGDGTKVKRKFSG